MCPFTSFMGIRHLRQVTFQVSPHSTGRNAELPPVSVDTAVPVASDRPRAATPLQRRVPPESARPRQFRPAVCHPPNFGKTDLARSRTPISTGAPPHIGRTILTLRTE